MGLNKQYDGYKSYQYLQAGDDYRAFEFHDPPTEWVEPYVVPVSEAEEARAQRLLAENIVISLHDHPVMIPKNVGELFEMKRNGREFTPFEALSRSGLDCIWDNLMDGTATITSKAGWKWEDVLFDLGMRLCDIGHQSFLVRCEGVQDVLAAHNLGRLAWVPALESATMIENELDRLDILYGFGVRSMGLIYSEANALGAGLSEARDGGLTELGRKAVARMNKLGIIVDVSHASDQSGLDAAAVSEQPVIVSHAGARALWNIKRLKPDAVLEAVAQSGGVIGIEAAPHTTLTANHTRHSIDGVMEHFEYCARLVGIEHVTFGPDTLYGDHVGLHHAYTKQLSIAGATAGAPDYEEVAYVKGLENATESFPNIVRWLVTHGYSDEDISKAVGGNTLRVMQAVWWH